MLITRNDISEMLLMWKNDTLNEKDVFSWVEENYFPGSADFDDWEGDSSVTSEVLLQLDSLDMNLIMKSDIEAYLEFLSTPLGHFELGYQKWRKYIDTINYEERKKELKGNSFYSNYCD